MAFFAPPDPGDIVYCRFPERGMPGPSLKPRPALVIAVGDVGGETYVDVAFGTSRHTDQLYSGEFLVSPMDGDAFVLSGLSYPTKFDLRNRRELPYDEVWFRIPPQPMHGQTPKLGVLHPSLMRAARAAFAAGSRQ